MSFAGAIIEDAALSRRCELLAKSLRLVVLASRESFPATTISLHGRVVRVGVECSRGNNDIDYKWTVASETWEVVFNTGGNLVIKGPVLLFGDVEEFKHDATLIMLTYPGGLT